MRLFLLVIISIFISAPSMAQTIAPIIPPTSFEQIGIISISGTGEITATPDMAYITSGVISIKKTAKLALHDNSKAMNELIAVLENAGIEKRDIQTSNFSISPQYAYNNSSNNEPPKIANYRVSNSVTIVVRNLDILGNIIDQAVSVGSNSINSVSFAIEDTSELLIQARKNAMANAIEKAQLYAKTANVSLGKIRLISENSSYPTQPQVDMLMARNMAAESAPTPMLSGELTFRSNVFVQWELEQ